MPVAAIQYSSFLTTIYKPFVWPHLVCGDVIFDKTIRWSLLTMVANFFAFFTKLLRNSLQSSLMV